MKRIHIINSSIYLNSRTEPWENRPPPTIPTPVLWIGVVDLPFNPKHVGTKVRLRPVNGIP